MSKFDVIIIGSGLGGLECAAILSKEGFNVCVLEKNAVFGGCLQSYDRKGAILDTGVHYVGSLEEGQFLNQSFKYFGIMDHLLLKKLDEDSFDKIHFAGKEFHYAMGDEQFVDVLSQSFPKERNGLKDYVNQLRSVGKSVSVENLKKGFMVDGGLDKFGVSAAGVIDSCTTDETLRNVLASTSLLHSNIKEKSSFYEHAMVMYSYLEGAYRCVNGSMQIANELIKEIRKNGGEVRKQSEVTRILVKNEVVVGVEVNNEDVVEGNYVISDAHPQTTLKLLDPNHSIKRIFHYRINSLENSFGIFTLHLLMKPEQSEYLNHNVYLHRGDSVWFDKKREKHSMSNCLISMGATTADKQKYAEVVSVLVPMSFSEVGKWKDTLPERRGEDYLHFKEEYQKRILDFIGEFGYDYANSFDYAYTSTPLSYRDYMGSPDGSAFGILKDYHNPLKCLVAPKTKLKGLLFTGQNINVHGVFGVTVSSIYTCSELLGLTYLTKKIGNV